MMLALSLSANVWGAPADEYAAAVDDWASVLSTYVDDQGRTDFIRLANDPGKLATYVQVVADYGPNTHPEDFTERETVLAYHINTYNALAMYGVIDEGIPKNFGSFFSYEVSCVCQFWFEHLCFLIFKHG